LKDLSNCPIILYRTVVFLAKKKNLPHFQNQQYINSYNDLSYVKS
jgi:hypothetical protein